MIVIIDDIRYLSKHEAHIHTCINQCLDSYIHNEIDI
jgi:hypothetical protein